MSLEMVYTREAITTIYAMNVSINFRSSLHSIIILCDKNI